MYTCGYDKVTKIANTGSNTTPLVTINKVLSTAIYLKQAEVLLAFFVTPLWYVSVCNFC